MAAYAAVSCRSAGSLVRPMHSPTSSHWRPQNRSINKESRHNGVLVGSALALLTLVSAELAVNSPLVHSDLALCSASPTSTASLCRHDRTGLLRTRSVGSWKYWRIRIS
ncbi:uncharacterized protein M421DRAFT_417282 [Didymella exigua CBS 183.55]|uniref:Uncharacterized protein n=1 Tax=Didymella exigua CBS 183.55 TaxID=1150837 RepID=A0A6A5RWE6_9PLEO|nr:uncharacterized protein M421DRAFT_417282 [Didymella exigua CBS 183.55]KAF1931514.1 hypothetical protein M421DRAFT_417282 [Didymella exigua CBS 183.55]